MQSSQCFKSMKIATCRLSKIKTIHVSIAKGGSSTIVCLRQGASSRTRSAFWPLLQMSPDDHAPVSENGGSAHHEDPIFWSAKRLAAGIDISLISQ